MTVKLIQSAFEFSKILLKVFLSKFIKGKKIKPTIIFVPITTRQQVMEKRAASSGEAPYIDNATELAYWKVPTKPGAAGTKVPKKVIDITEQELKIERSKE